MDFPISLDLSLPLLYKSEAIARIELRQIMECLFFDQGKIASQGKEYLRTSTDESDLMVWVLALTSSSSTKQTQ